MADNGANGANSANGDAGQPEAPEAPSALPPLQALNLANLQHHNAAWLRDNDPYADLLQNGVYCLDKLTWEATKGGMFSLSGCESRLILIRGALKFDGVDAKLDELADFMMDDDKVPKTMKQGNVVGRKECTFGADYKKYGVPIPLRDAPDLAKLVLDYTRKVAEDNPNQTAGPAGPVSFTGVHCNWYADGKAGVQPHQDDEKQLIKGAPIFSYTFIRNADGSTAANPMPREFRIYNAEPLGGDKRKRGEKVGSIWLGQGDLLIMAGDMQTYFFHEVPKTNNKIYSNTQRINMTVRAFTPDAVAAAELL